MEQLVTLFILVFSAYFVFRGSYNFVWFKVNVLFDNISLHCDEDFDSLSTNLKGKLNEYKDTFIQKFYSEYSISSKKMVESIRILFSIAAVSYVITMEIVLRQIRIASSETKFDFITNWIWPFTSMMLSLILILIQPFFIFISLLNKFYNDTFDMDRLVMVTSAILFVCITTLALVNLGPFQYTSNILTRLSIGGVTIMAMLSGIACASTLYYTYLFIKNRSKRKYLPISSTAADSIQNRKLLLWSNRSRFHEKLDYYQNQVRENIATLESLDKENDESYKFKNDHLLEKISIYQVEISHLQDAINEPSHVTYIKRCFEFMFLIYCAHKVIFTFTRKIPLILIHLINHPKDYEFQYFDNLSDPLAVTFANILDFFLFHFNYQHDLDSLTNQISLLLSASLFIMSLSTVNTTISFILALLPAKFQLLAVFAMQSTENVNELPLYKSQVTTRKGPSIIKNLLVSELTGVYVVATILMIRSNLPFEVASSLKYSLGDKFTIPSIVIDCWFDQIYGIFCILTIAFIKLAERTLLLRSKPTKLSTRMSPN
ncbi:hypothetical protein KAFR_0D04750 [Kazachstania africana CBS 2517]|uniref:Abscisic acid G-protein coupled receptor-like domain-containing protein n=1 Tax=Kazachstania africana (strain ATCC 22294 / BCRC 22015 / CBS 2517 / CECT 1963 / NBRC 1671 / NRRL Y-8276) TaxID=1071382 RepID=H2AUS2_KAZAF|nr:hypothetical protein KAFR_0D04750 [Kazachstania africana CBS 2517]CCF58122.1 hypothetical protein KAFR_0D04750 [Kazachstania africana CBS 2517]